MAGYIAKYATKGAETAGTVDRPIRTVHAIPYLDVTDHARRMIDTCWLLAEVPAYVDLGLAADPTCLATEATSSPSRAPTQSLSPLCVPLVWVVDRLSRALIHQLGRQPLAAGPSSAAIGDVTWVRRYPAPCESHLLRFWRPK